ncbi:MFS transporter [Pseudonocardia sp. KRD-184]|uniref:MFS transporter n=1 Tax=Pseudonocardia oceani TaxID=2792013 RepID=A0ABS6UF46_9PSEU|nr:MFS transporter [Pseudonocardia oceani]MBW0089171.1 MFS transporter [Pseudonocardia oceani]MBW0096116.1 MFS transporter [Pseudonocardia oceani]MBW0111261.1 MFS transporter [Pseudonocardia oceani]MBW0120960.1 MFS transporter [Pseudonocardia oceani]MBW0130867.1 MFS transporter [Pseudonocardia oceani]
MPAPVPVPASVNAADPAPPAVRGTGLFLALVCSTQFVLLVGGTVVTVSLPAIGAELALTPGQAQGVLTAFMLTFGCLLLLGGRAADVLGRRRLFLVGLAVFAVGSLLCAVATSAGLLIAARVLAGTGAAMASPAAMSLLTTVFVTPRERSRALGMWAAVGAIGATLGNVIGGLLTSVGGWRWIFLVNVPVCVLAFVAAFSLVPAVPRVRGQRLALPDGLLATGAVAALILGLTQVQSGAVPLGAALVAVAVVLGGLFALLQARADDPLLPLSLFRTRTATAFLFVLITAGTSIGSYFTSSLYMQDTLGWSALQAGLAFVPWAALIAVVAQIVSRNLHRVGPRLLVPLALTSVAAGGTLLALSLRPGATYLTGLLPAFLLLGLGTGAAGVACTVTAMSGIPRRRHGVGAGALNSTQAVGSALAIALVALLAQLGTAFGPAGDAVAATLAGQRFALLVASAVALLGAVLAAVVLPRRVPAPAGPEADVALSPPAATPLT